ERIDRIITAQQSNHFFLMSHVYSSIHLSLIRLSKSNNKNEIIFEKQIDTELDIFGSLVSQNTTVLCEQIGGSLLRS
ncbi:unnamed protein product, partial [Rotaria sp. Silwood2]